MATRKPKESKMEAAVIRKKVLKNAHKIRGKKIDKPIDIQEESDDELELLENELNIDDADKKQLEEINTQLIKRMEELEKRIEEQLKQKALDETKIREEMEKTKIEKRNKKKKELDDRFAKFEDTFNNKLKQTSGINQQISHLKHKRLNRLGF